MAGIEIKTEVDATKRFERLRRGTGVTFTRFSKSIGRKIGNKHKKFLLAELKIYAPKRPGQRYKRTFRLRRGWTVLVRTPRTGFMMITDNDTSYTHFVVGQPDLRFTVGGKNQAWMHKGRWWIAGGVAKKHYDNAEKEYIDEMYNTLEEQADVNIKRRSKLTKS